jgi:hypothetical protein
LSRPADQLLHKSRLCEKGVFADLFDRRIGLFPRKGFLMQLRDLQKILSALPSGASAAIPYEIYAELFPEPLRHGKAVVFARDRSNRCSIDIPTGETIASFLRNL